MARNSEKAQAMLNKYLRGKEEEARGPKVKRPYLATECHDLNECDKWRAQILREIGKKVMEIQNAGLGEHRIRDMNDEINKLVREKGHWEKQIVKLGGPDYAKTGPKVTDSEGREMQGASGKGSGYRYFGAAKNLPGVKELFEKEKPRAVRRSRWAMHKGITPDYYGFRDEEDGVLLRVEAAAERKLRAEALAEWKEKEAEREAARASVRGGEAGVSEAGDGAEGAEAARFVAYVPLPDDAAIEAMVLKKKKDDLLSKYSSDALLAKQAEAKAMLNVQD